MRGSGFFVTERLRSSWKFDTYLDAFGLTKEDLKREGDGIVVERIGLSESRDLVLVLAREGALAESAAAQLRDPYVFEFLGLERREVMSESALERALVDHLQHFLFELGRDFCFIARQFRITAGNRHHYLDLLFYHRRLRCLVAIDLKLGAFEPDHAGQLRFYVNYLAEHVAHPDENPPVGILLCAERDAEVVPFATRGRWRSLRDPLPARASDRRAAQTLAPRGACPARAGQGRLGGSSDPEAALKRPQVALAYPELDAVDLSRRLSLQSRTAPLLEIRQTSGESTATPAIRQTSGELAGSFGMPGESGSKAGGAGLAGSLLQGLVKKQREPRSEHRKLHKPCICNMFYDPPGLRLAPQSTQS